jgi:hypothetical protein
MSPRAGRCAQRRFTVERSKAAGCSSPPALEHFLRSWPARRSRKYARFNNFTPDNDPYKEHDFGRFEAGGRTFIWKIDYYDKSMTLGAEDPADPERTTRVLTIMLAEDY